MSDKDKAKPAYQGADDNEKNQAKILVAGTGSEEPITLNNGADAPSDSDLTGRAKELFDRAYTLESQLNVADENGLFVHQTIAKYDDILDNITQVYDTSLQSPITSKMYSDAIKLLDHAENQLDTALQKIGLRRRLVYVYGLPTAFYLLGVLGVIVWLAFHPPSILSGNSTIISIPLNIMGAGVVGGVLRGMKGLWSQVDKLQYRKFWGTWFLLCPIMGALLGGVVYLLFEGGILVSTGGTTITNPIFPIFLAILAGYNWEWAEGVLANVPSLFSVGSANDKSKSKNKGKNQKTNGSASSP